MIHHVALCIAAILTCLSPLFSANELLWDFTKGPSGWIDEADSEPRETDLGLKWPGSSAGLSLRSPELNLKTEAFHTIEATLAFDKPGVAHIVWLGTAVGELQPRWHGPLPLTAPADGVRHEVRIFPHWQNVETVQALRIMAPPGTAIHWSRLRITAVARPLADLPRWTPLTGPQAGQWLTLAGGATLQPTGEGLAVTLSADDVTLTSPALAFPAHRHEWLSVTMSGDGLTGVALQWATTGERGLHSASFNARNGRLHTYNFRAAVHRSWSGMLRGLALRLVGRPGARATVHAVGVHDYPQGPPQPETLFLGPKEPLVRQSQPCTMIWVLHNTGGEAVEQLSARLVTPTGETIAADSENAREHIVSRMDFGVPEMLAWRLDAVQPGEYQLQASFNGGEITERVSLEPAPPAENLVAGSVPPPQAQPPADGVPVAARYHDPPPAPWLPGALDRFLFNRPWAGDYAICPEVMDWQIKWALEHGVSALLFSVSTGTDGRLSHPALDAFLGSQFGRRMQFSLVWDDPRPTVPRGRRLVHRLSPVLALPNALSLSGSPVLFVGNPLVSTEEGLQLADLSELFDDNAVFPIACTPLHLLSPQVLQAGGYKAACALGSSENALPGDGLVQSWDMASAVGLPHVPAVITAAHTADRPRLLTTFTRIALLRARRGAPGVLPLVVAGDFNGPDGLEPARPHGLTLLGAVGAAMGMPPVDVVLPQDVGLGPYDRPLPSPPTEWHFDRRDSWTSAMGFGPLHLADGRLSGTTDSNSPALFGGDTMLDTRRFNEIVLRMQVSAGTAGRLWWRTSLRGFCLEQSLPLEITADGQLHEYRVSVGASPHWRGYLTSLRVDPTDISGAEVALDYVGIIP